MPVSYNDVSSLNLLSRVVSLTRPSMQREGSAEIPRVNWLLQLYIIPLLSWCYLAIYVVYINNNY